MFTPSSENEHLWWELKAANRDSYLHALARPELQAQRAPGTRRYTTFLGQELHTPPGLSEAHAHKVAKHMAVAYLSPLQRAAYERGRLKVYVVDELGRKHSILHAKPGRLGVTT